MNYVLSQTKYVKDAIEQDINVWILKKTSSAGRQKGLTGYCFKCIDRPFCLQTDDIYYSSSLLNHGNINI